MKMAEALPSTSSESISDHEKNLAMLFDKLKELKKATTNRSDASIYNIVESKYPTIFFGWQCI